MAVKTLDDQAISEVARRIRSPEARQAYLAPICGDDPATTDCIKALLKANASTCCSQRWAESNSARKRRRSKTTRQWHTTFNIRNGPLTAND